MDFMDFIDWSNVNWTAVVIHSAMAVIAAFIANLVNLLLGDNRVLAAILTGVFFAIVYIGWNYYPHGIELPYMIDNSTQ